MTERPKTSRDHASLGGVKIVDFDANMVQWFALAESLRDPRWTAAGVECHVVIVRPDMDIVSTFLSRAAPASPIATPGWSAFRTGSNRSMPHTG
jgi:hypothetical protein